MVRLKARNAFVASKAMIEFQFHYGTIKRVYSWCRRDNRMGFQFHYGTIKSSTHILKVYPFLDFNSTMVRLKAS